MKPTYDVVVVGGGNAALCAAMEAARGGASVAILEAAPKHLRGGNSRHTRNCRYMHDGPQFNLVGTYSEDEFFSDLLQVTGGETNERLARLTIQASQDLGTWIRSNGVRWQEPLKGTLQLSRTNAFFLGGGKALVNTYYEETERLQIDTCYEAEVCDIVYGESAGIRVVFEVKGIPETTHAGAVVVASGGFEANIDWLAENWGEAARNFAIRGTAYNRGRPMATLIERGAKAVGSPREFHSIAVDARGPMFDGGIVTRLDTLPFGIVVNNEGLRFSDEGIDIWPKRYASWGGLIARQDGQVAFSILDAKMATEFMPSLYPPLQAQSIPELGRALKLDPETLSETVSRFNQSVVPGTYDPTTLDDCYTQGLEIPKSHWARKIDTPPYLAYPLRTGITFSYHCLAVDERARVLAANNEPIRGVYAAGEAMAGNILGRGYLAGFGMTIGSVFGRIAGREAAQHALG